MRVLHYLSIASGKAGGKWIYEEVHIDTNALTVSDVEVYSGGLRVAFENESEDDLTYPVSVPCCKHVHRRVCFLEPAIST